MRTIAGLALLLVACGGSPEPKAADAPMTTAKPAAASQAGTTAQRVPISHLERAQVKLAIGKGLGVFLRNLSVDDYPVMKEGRFYGFRLKSLNPDWAIDLRPGDVVIRVNGQVIERPEQADAAMRSLEKAAALKIEYERDGKAQTLEIPIRD